ncbi:DUF1565 domain-containing protein, partial [bacterium]|nr:DUF1565 domain-containing protein [bacterium]
MKGISKIYSYYFKLLTMILLCTFLYTCAGVMPTDYTITATTSVGGSINPAGAITVTDGGNQSFTIIPDQCYEIADILVDGTIVGPIETYTFSDIDQNHTIQVSFVLNSKVYNIETGIHYNTIQMAIYAARSGDTILVCPGNYEENIVFNKEDLIVRSIDPSDPSIVAATIIDGGGNGSVVRFDGDDTSTLEGFTIKNGHTTYGGGIYVSGSSPTIIGNIISNNEANDGAGIYVYRGSPIIT